MTEIKTLLTSLLKKRWIVSLYLRHNQEMFCMQAEQNGPVWNGPSFVSKVVCMYDLCMIYVWPVYDLFMTYVWPVYYIYDLCMTYAWPVYDICMTYVWLVYDICMTRVWNMYDWCMMHLWPVYDLWFISMTCVLYVWPVCDICMKFPCVHMPIFLSFDLPLYDHGKWTFITSESLQLT